MAALQMARMATGTLEIGHFSGRRLVRYTNGAQPGTIISLRGQMSGFLGVFLRPFRASRAWIAVSARFRRASAQAPLPGTMDDIASYHRARRDAAVALSDRTWNDLEFDGVFRLADHCISAIGQQILYALLRRPQLNPAEVTRRDAIIRSLDTDSTIKEDVRQALCKLKTRSAYYLYRLFAEELPPRPRLFFVFPLLSLASIIGLLTLFISPGAGLWILIVAVCANVGVKLYYRPRFEHLIQPIMAVRALLAAAEILAKHESASLRAWTGELAARCKRLRWIKGAARWLVIEDTGNEVVSSLAAWANLLFLLDVNAFVLNIERLRRSSDDLHAIFLTIGTTDALCAIGAFRKMLPHWSAPRLGPSAKQLRCEGVFHPVIAEPVPNDCHVDGRSLLITGSNMAGKSTYLRAVGTSAVLAQALATVPARSWVAPVLRVETLVRRGDELMHGRSYFYTEAERVKEMLDIAAGEQRCLFIVDELYRGTNTRERVAAAYAVLDHLDSMGHLCLVATHDLELVNLLADRWDTWHFAETVDRTSVIFDYRIRAGAATSPNALRLLHRLDYPPDVLRQAYDAYRASAEPKSEDIG